MLTVHVGAPGAIGGDWGAACMCSCSIDGKAASLGVPLKLGDSSARYLPTGPSRSAAHGMGSLARTVALLNEKSTGTGGNASIQRTRT